MSGIDNAKKAQGWVHSNARPACGNCGHVAVENMSGPRKQNFYCRKGGFYTPRYAICEAHMPLQLTGGTPT